MKYRYETKCPMHSQNIQTSGIQSFKYGNEYYSGPIFYCGKCMKYYQFVIENTSFTKLRTLAPSGLPIEIRKGIVVRNRVTKKGVEIVSIEQTTEPNTVDLLEMKEMKKSERKKRNTQRKAIIEKNNQTRKMLQESSTYIRCEMTCPHHEERVMTTRNCIDVELNNNLPLFYCIDCDRYYISCDKLRIMKLGQINSKDFWNCDNEVVISNPDKGTLNSIGTFSGTDDLKRSFNDTEELENEGLTERKLVNEVKIDSNEDQHELVSVQVVKPEKKDKEKKPRDGIKETNIDMELVFDDWSFEDTEDELFKDFLRKE